MKLDYVNGSRTLSERMKKRNEKILKWRAYGVSFGEIAKLVNLSRQRVYQIYRREIEK